MTEDEKLAVDPNAIVRSITVADRGTCSGRLGCVGRF